MRREYDDLEKEFSDKRTETLETLITYMEGSLGPKLTELNTAILLQESRFRHEHPVSVFITCGMYQQV